MEDYLRAIYLLEKENKVARVSEIGRHLNVKKASVVSAVVNLRKAGLLDHEKYGFINLTESGRNIAESILKKQKILYNFLSEYLKVDGETASKEACKLEHVLSGPTVRKLVLFLKTCGDTKEAKTKKTLTKNTRGKQSAKNKKKKKS